MNQYFWYFRTTLILSCVGNGFVLHQKWSVRQFVRSLVAEAILSFTKQFLCIHLVRRACMVLKSNQFFESGFEHVNRHQFSGSYCTRLVLLYCAQIEHFCLDIKVNVWCLETLGTVERKQLFCGIKTILKKIEKALITLAEAPLLMWKSSAQNWEKIHLSGLLLVLSTLFVLV